MSTETSTPATTTPVTAPPAEATPVTPPAAPVSDGPERIDELCQLSAEHARNGEHALAAKHRHEAAELAELHERHGDAVCHYLGAADACLRAAEAGEKAALKGAKGCIDSAMKIMEEHPLRMPDHVQSILKDRKAQLAYQLSLSQS